MRQSTLFLLGFLLLAIATGAPAAEEPPPCGEDAPCEASGSADTQDTIRVIGYDDLRSMIDAGADFTLLDTRPELAYQVGHIPGAQSLPLESITQETADQLPKSKLLIVYCQSDHCNTSHMAAVKLKQYGIDVVDFKGGVQEWTSRGNKLIRVTGAPSAQPIH